MNIETLNKFASKHEARLNINHVFSQGKYTIAINGRVMIRVPRIKGVKKQDHPDVFTSFPIPKIKESFEIPDIILTEIICNECAGTGKQLTENCLNCNGTGKVPDKGKYHLINGVAFADYLLKLLKDNCPNVRITPRKYENGIPSPAYFTFDGGHGFLMPMRIS